MISRLITNQLKSFQKQEFSLQRFSQFVNPKKANPPANAKQAKEKPITEALGMFFQQSDP